MSLAKLTSLSTQTLSLLLERQRLLSLPLPVVTPTSATPAQNLHLPQIARNLQQLRGGVRALEPSEASVLLRLQYTRMRDMLESKDDGESWSHIASGEATTSWYQGVGKAVGSTSIFAVGHSGQIVRVGS